MQQQQLDEQSLKLLIDLFNESQIPDNEKQKEVHQVSDHHITLYIF